MYWGQDKCIKERHGKSLTVSFSTIWLKQDLR